jgi:hypothetical protein
MVMCNAVLGALQESLIGLYSDQLRAMREAGLSDEVSGGFLSRNQ